MTRAKARYQRRIQRRAKSGPPPALSTINDLAKAARTSWLTLLTFLASIGVTLLSVEDIDFFVDSRQTDLPLIGIAIPARLFFWVAPILAAALFSQLHFHLLKLWEATEPASAPATIDGAPLSDHLAASFITDLALANRADGALRPRPMRWPTRWITALLIFAATPIILGFFWWRSMPAHQSWLTFIGTGLPLSVTLYITLRSFIRMLRLQWGKGDGLGNWRPATLRRLAGLCLITFISGWGYIRTEWSLAEYLAAKTDEAGEPIWSTGEINNLRSSYPYAFLASANLRNANLIQAPQDWPTY